MLVTINEWIVKKLGTNAFFKRVSQKNLIEKINSVVILKSQRSNLVKIISVWGLNSPKNDLKKNWALKSLH